MARLANKVFIVTGGIGYRRGHMSSLSRRVCRYVQRKVTIDTGESRDVANGVLFLASDEAKFVIGAGVICHGGYAAQ
jgi:NAD(P)-dependent dehydrogenase (short-subunit alcohol dehydrogenase family)